MSITFEECYSCGNPQMRREGILKYNQSQNEFYYVWECFSPGCKNVIYEIVKFEEMEDAENKRKKCLFCQKWNEIANKYNEGLKTND
jgi:hypothetical protein